MLQSILVDLTCVAQQFEGVKTFLKLDFKFENSKHYLKIITKEITGFV